MKTTTFNFDNADFSFSDVKNCRRDRGFYKAYNLVGLDDDNNLHEVAEIRYYAAASGNTNYCVFGYTTTRIISTVILVARRAVTVMIRPMQHLRAR